MLLHLLFPLRDEFHDVVSRIDRLVLISPVDFAIEKRHPVFNKIEHLPQWMVLVGAATGLLREKVARAVRDGAGEPNRMPREEADRLLGVFLDAELRRLAPRIDIDVGE